MGFPENCADVRIAQYESDVRTPKEDLLKLFASTLGVPIEILTVPVPVSYTHLDVYKRQDLNIYLKTRNTNLFYLLLQLFAVHKKVNPVFL